MGEAKRKAEEAAAGVAAVNGSAPTPVKLTPMQLLVVLQLDLACAVIGSIANQLGTLQQVEPAQELAKSIEHIQHYKARFLGAAARRVLIAQPGDLTKLG